MTDLLEHELRDLFAADAEHAPVPHALARTAIHRVQRRRRATAAFAGGSLAVVAVVIAATGAVNGGRSPGHHIAGPARHGALPNSGLFDCIGYNASMVADLTFAFDGTVTAIGPRTTIGNYALPVVSVTFKVHEWFHGGEGSAANVTMNAPENSMVGLEEMGPSYAVGTRLLVGGQPDESGEPFAWSCGLTRYYDIETANEWRAASAHRGAER